MQQLFSSVVARQSKQIYSQYRFPPAGQGLSLPTLDGASSVLSHQERVKPC